jgi:tetratricopeptide (TPR) repeat protein
MPTEYDNELLREGILHYKVKEYETARKYIERALASADDLQTRLQAYYYLSLLTEDREQKRKYLEETLAIDMTHAEARRALAILDGKLKASDIVNPDNLPSPASGTIAVQADRFTCPKCGGRMVYAPDGVSLFCEYCNQNQHMSGKDIAGEQDFFIAMANGSSQRARTTMQTFLCQGCGATFVLAPEEISATCAYCGSVHVVASEEKRQLIEPDSILPMMFNQKQASWHLVHWVESMKIKPQDQVQAPRGLYLPVWSFDFSGRIPWKGLVYRNKREVPVSGEQDTHFNDVRILGSKKLAALMTKALPDFELSVAVAYDPRFLAGWMAEVYDLPMADASLEARQIIVEKMRAIVRGQFGQVMDLGYATSGVMINAFKLILVPVWVTEIKVRDQSGRVLINGQTGSVHSEIQPGGLAGWLGNVFGGR